MIKTELFLTLFLLIMITGSLSVSSFESNAQNLSTDVIKFSPFTVMEFSSSSVITSSSTSSVNCIVEDCFKFMMTTGMIKNTPEYPRDSSISVMSEFIDYEEQLTTKPSMKSIEKIPDWTKNIFLWYGQDKVSEEELLNAIKYLDELFE